MTFSTERTPVDKLRRSLTSLTIDTRARGKDHRVSKPRQPDRAKTKTHELRPRYIQTRRKLLRLQPEQQDRAIAIFSTLQHVQHFAKLAPRLCPRQSYDPARGQVELEYPCYRFSQCLDGRSLDDLRSMDLPGLRRYIIQDLKLLYAQRLPYTPDITRLEVVEKTSSMPGVWPTLRPFIGALDFDLDIDINDPTIPWAELMSTRRRMVEAQFDVLELLVRSSEPAEVEPRRLSIGLDPRIVGDVLRKVYPPIKESGQIIRRLERYASELGRFLIENGRFHLLSMPRREKPKASSDWIEDRIEDYLPIIDHVLSLIDISIQNGGIQNSSFLLDRAALLVIQATMLIHQHAKAIPVYMSSGLLQKTNNDTANSYTTYEGFVSVVHTRRMAENAVRELAETGGELDKNILCFV
ncbi:hypothetical protein HD806DRAFT_412434 [Xylariaceae sp. AK1471]|nr:hypothetical protein HD806DRAFT_412434 [Xylariaceae sp. AK1471]